MVTIFCAHFRCARSCISEGVPLPIMPHDKQILLTSVCGGNDGKDIAQSVVDILEYALVRTPSNRPSPSKLGQLSRKVAASLIAKAAAATPQQVTATA